MMKTVLRFDLPVILSPIDSTTSAATPGQISIIFALFYFLPTVLLISILIIGGSVAVSSLNPVLILSLTG